ncbi:MAG: hypothetical protein OEY89_14105, partial [Gammaproteobacteria bacterium]|nr:hypothetical protein [Gammaproteobacteria bacterium]
GIIDLTDDQLAHGVNQVRKSCEWPPSIAEFRRLCVVSDDNWRHKTFAYNDMTGIKAKVLPILKAQESVSSEAREKFKKMGLLK